MKTRFIIIASVLLALTSCGTTASLTQAPAQKYQDGIYYRPQNLSLDAQAAQLKATDDLIARTKSSAVFVKTVGKVDTLIIPDNMSASFKFNHKDSTTTVSLYDLDDLNWWSWNYSPWYSYGFGWPYYGSYIGSYRWYRNMYWGFYDPFWYDPFWYDPFWGPYWSIGLGPFWHDPFFYGGPFGWYDPFFYAGYYGYPYYYGGGGGAYFGPRYHSREIATRSGQANLISTSPRGGVGRVVRTGTGRTASGSSSAAKASSPARMATASRTSTSGSASAAARIATRTVSTASRSASTATRAAAAASTRAASTRSASPAVSGSTTSGAASTRSASTSGSTYRRSTPTTSSGSYSSSSRSSSSGSYSAPSRSSSSSGSYSAPSRSSSSGSFGGGSYSGGGASRSSGGSFGGGSSSSSSSAGRSSGGGGGRR